jgi:hypothetical protein
MAHRSTTFVVRVGGALACTYIHHGYKPGVKPTVQCIYTPQNQFSPRIPRFTLKCSHWYLTNLPCICQISVSFYPISTSPYLPHPLYLTHLTFPTSGTSAILSKTNHQPVINVTIMSLFRLPTLSISNYISFFFVSFHPVCFPNTCPVSFIVTSHLRHLTSYISIRLSLRHLPSRLHQTAKSRQPNPELNPPPPFQAFLPQKKNVIEKGGFLGKKPILT